MNSTQHREAVAAELRATAARKGLGQSEIAALTGMSRSALSRKWRGQTPVTVDELLSIARALDVSPAELIPTPTAA